MPANEWQNNEIGGNGPGSNVRYSGKLFAQKKQFGLGVRFASGLAAILLQLIL